MATYKVLQDIEAEDKLIGPFTLKQFIFAGITIIIGFIGFQILISGAPAFIMVPMLILLLPFFLLFGFLAAPIGRDQSTETWLLARLRFLFKPRTRIWSQDGYNELVTITVPKKIETVYTKDFTQDEVHSRLRALANTVDSRGWAVKNVSTNLFNQPDYIQTSAASSDRLLDPASMPQQVPTINVLPSDDIMDTENNATAQHFQQMIQESSNDIKKQAIDNMQVPSQPLAQAMSDSTAVNQPEDYYFMHENTVDTSNTPSDYVAFSSQNVVTPGSAESSSSTQETAEEQEIARQAAERDRAEKEFVYNRGPVIQPIHDEAGNLIKQSTEPAKTTNDLLIKTPVEVEQNNANAGIIEGVNIDKWKSADRNIDSLAREANRAKELEKSNDQEVVISLH